jgi:hypothetical protein
LSTAPSCSGLGFASAYLFGAVCPSQGKAAALIMPICNTAAMNHHLCEISSQVAADAHAVVILDPVQRFVGGGLIGAGSGAAIGAAAAGGHGAALGAPVGGAVGAVTGLITTPPPPTYHGYYNHPHYASYSGRRHHAPGSTATAASTNAPSGY